MTCDGFLLNLVLFFFLWKVSFVTFRLKYARFELHEEIIYAFEFVFFVHYTVEYLNNVLAAYKSAL